MTIIFAFLIGSYPAQSHSFQIHNQHVALCSFSFLTSPSRWGFPRAMKSLYNDAIVMKQLYHHQQAVTASEEAKYNPKAAAALRASDELVAFMIAEDERKDSNYSSKNPTSLVQNTGLNLLALWKELDEYPRLPSSVRYYRAYSIYEGQAVC